MFLFKNLNVSEMKKIFPIKSSLSKIKLREKGFLF